MNKYQLIKPALFAMLLLLAACDPKVESGGYLEESSIKDRVVVGQTTRDEVAASLGSPSSQSSFGKETWYYISNRKETYAFLKPEIAAQDVTRIEFDTNGVVSAVETYDKNNGQEFDLVKRTTPTEGHTLGFVEQVLGNIGRFNSSKDTAAPGRRPSGSPY